MTLVASSRPPRPTSTTAISTVCAPEQLEGDRRRALEKGRQRFEPAVGNQPFDRRLDRRGRCLEVGRRDLALADDEALLDPFEVRRRVPRRAVPGGVERGGRHGRHRPLAVGAGDDDRLKARSGCPSAAQIRRMFSRPNFIPRRSSEKRNSRGKSDGQGLAAARATASRSSARIAVDRRFADERHAPARRSAARA